MQPRSGRAAASPGERCVLLDSDGGPQRGPVWGAVKTRRGYRVDRLDGTPMGFMIEQGSGDAAFPGERSLSLGTSGLHDSSPLGLKARRGTDAWRISVEQAKQSGHLAPQDERKACAGMQSFELRECQARRSGMAAWLRLNAGGGLAPKCNRLGDCERLSVRDVQLISTERGGYFANASLAASR